MSMYGRRPRARIGKKQAIVFLRPRQASAAHQRAARTERTNQDVLCDAMNAVFTYYGVPTMAPPESNRAARSQQSKAAVRESSNSPACRTGRQSYAGWFPEADVDRFQRLCKENGFSMQSALEFGMALVTGVQPDEGVGWRDVAAATDAGVDTDPVGAVSG